MALTEGVDAPAQVLEHPAAQQAALEAPHVGVEARAVDVHEVGAGGLALQAVGQQPDQLQPRQEVMRQQQVLLQQVPEIQVLTLDKRIRENAGALGFDILPER